MSENEAPEAVAELPVKLNYGVYGLNYGVYDDGEQHAVSAALPLLRRPFTPAAIKWKVQASNYRKDKQVATWAIIVGYIDARLVIDRLNMVCGQHWEEEPVRIGDRNDALLYKLKVFGQTHIDVGVEQGATEGMKLKSLHSDALKRTAVRFGVGVSIYAAPQIMLDVTEGGEEKSGAPTIKRRWDEKPGRLEERHAAYCRAVYGQWLQTEGIAAFGEPLDHGDAEDSAGDLVDGPEAEETSAAALPAQGLEPLEDERAEKLRGTLLAIRDEIREQDPDALPDVSFDDAVNKRAHDHALLEEFIGKLEELRGHVERVAALEVEVKEKLTEAGAKKAIEKANRRYSRTERAEVLEGALEKAAGKEEKS